MNNSDPSLFNKSPRLPLAYYLFKRALSGSMNRFRRSDHHIVLQKIKSQPFDCLSVFETDCASKRYRVDHAIEIFSMMEFDCLSLSLAEIESLQDFNELRSSRFVLLHRIPMNPVVARLMRWCNRMSIPVIFDLDDAIHDPEIYQRSAVFEHLNKIERHLHLRMAHQIGQALERADAVTVSTETLVDYARLKNHNIHLIPNRVSPMMIATALRVESDDFPWMTMGYLSGSDTHRRDFASIQRILKTVLADVPESRLLIAGLLPIPDLTESVRPDRITRLPFQPWPDFLSAYSRIGINLAPLEPENPFCLAKSGIKFLEAAISCVPTIAYPTKDFQRLIRHGETGFLAKTPTDWNRILHHCLSEPGVYSIYRQRSAQIRDGKRTPGEKHTGLENLPRSGGSILVKILQIVHQLPLRGGAGAENYTMQIAEALSHSA